MNAEEEAVARVRRALLGEEIPEWKRAYLVQRWLGKSGYNNLFHNNAEWRSLDWSEVNARFDLMDIRGAKRATLKLAGEKLRKGISHGHGYIREVRVSNYSVKMFRFNVSR